MEEAEKEAEANQEVHIEILIIHHQAIQAEQVLLIIQEAGTETQVEAEANHQIEIQAEAKAGVETEIEIEVQAEAGIFGAEDDNFF